MRQKKEAFELDSVQKWYEGVFQRRGVSSNGVGWKSPEGQIRRFEILLSVLGINSDFFGEDAGAVVRLVDFGCGYGALAEYLLAKFPYERFSYKGLDINKDVISAAHRLFSDPRLKFFHIPSDATSLPARGDFGLISGVFNMKGDNSDSSWRLFIEKSLRQMVKKCSKGLAFNMLKEGESFISKRFFHEDPARILSFCRSQFEGQWSLHGGENAQEFTVCGLWEQDRREINLTS